MNTIPHSKNLKLFPTLAAIFLLPLQGLIADDLPSAMLLARADDAPGQAALQKLRADLTTRYTLTVVDFQKESTPDLPRLAKAKLLVIAQTPDTWPPALTTAVAAGMDRGLAIVVLDAGLATRTSSNTEEAAFWQRLALVQGCAVQCPVSPELMAAPQKSGPHPAGRGVAPESTAALTPSAPPRHVMEKLAADDTGRTRAWISAYTARNERIGQVAVLPLTSSAALASPDVRRLVLHAGLTITGNRDLIPAAGLPVVP